MERDVWLEQFTRMLTAPPQKRVSPLVRLHTPVQCQ
jgi:hypothetical protein